MADTNATPDQDADVAVTSSNDIVEEKTGGNAHNHDSTNQKSKKEILSNLVKYVDMGVDIVNVFDETKSNNSNNNPKEENKLQPSRTRSKLRMAMAKNRGTSSMTDSESRSDNSVSGLDQIVHGYTILDESVSPEGKFSLPMPYKSINDRGLFLFIFDKIVYTIHTLIVKNPRLYSLWLLYKCVFPRALVLVDMFSDGLVAYQLLDGKETLLFSLSCLFIVFPYYMVWNTSLRFVQRHLAKRAKKKRKMGYILNTCLILYLFPPFGCMVATIYEILWVFYDIFVGLYSFSVGTILLIDKDEEMTSIKNFRKVIEVC